MSVTSGPASRRLYWPAQMQRNRGVRGLFVVVALFLFTWAAAIFMWRFGERRWQPVQ